MIDPVEVPAIKRTRTPSNLVATTTAVRAVQIALLAAIAGVAAGFQQPAAGSRPGGEQLDPNPCIAPEAAPLRCPDLVMRRPYGLYTDRLTKAGHTVLRAGNAIDSVGLGPAELHGVRTGRRW